MGGSKAGSRQGGQVAGSMHGRERQDRGCTVWCMQGVGGTEQRTQGGEQVAQVRRKKKKEAQEIKSGSGVYIGVVESS